MFSDCDNNPLGFQSNWKNLRTKEETGIQTTVVGHEDKHVQTKPSYNIEVQTEEERPVTTAVYDEARLGAFLSRVCPAVLKELDKVGVSNSFLWNSDVAESEQDVWETMRVPAADDGRGLQVTALSWSCTGTVLAVALAHFQHSSWCDHLSYISLYNVEREDKSLIKTLDARSCVRCVSMHPVLPSLLAAATYSGEVLLWDTAVEGTDSALACEGSASHGDVVTQVRWIVGVGSSVTLASCSLDGHVILWKVSPKLSSYQAVARYKCGTETGITCLAFTPHITDMFVAALEGGVLLLCSTLAKSIDPGDTVVNPTINEFEPLPATVSALEFSPHHEDLFATVSTDQAIRIFLLNQMCAQCVIWGGGGPMCGLSWSPSQDNVVAAWGQSARVAVFDSATGRALNSLSPTNSESNVHITAVSFNLKSPRLLAVGGSDGITRIWKIPCELNN